MNINIGQHLQNFGRHYEVWRRSDGRLWVNVVHHNQAELRAQHRYTPKDWWNRYSHQAPNNDTMAIRHAGNLVRAYANEFQRGEVQFSFGTPGRNPPPDPPHPATQTLPEHKDPIPLRISTKAKGEAIGAAPMVIYVGDAGDIVKRILTNHCSGNVEGSALRKHIATSKGFRISCTKRTTGSTRVRIDSADPRRDEARISAYIRSGLWRIISCSSYEEAHDFQWFAIEQLKPRCNAECRAWDRNRSARYQQLFVQLTSSQPLTYHALKTCPIRAPGVYVLEHSISPDSPDA